MIFIDIKTKTKREEALHLMSTEISAEYNLPEYHNFCYIEELVTVPILNLFQRYKGNYWVLPGQKQ